MYEPFDMVEIIKHDGIATVIAIDKENNRELPLGEKVDCEIRPDFPNGYALRLVVTISNAHAGTYVYRHRFSTEKSAREFYEKSVLPKFNEANEINKITYFK